MSIELFKLEKTQNRVWFDFGTSRRLLPYFHFGSEFFIEYDRDISIVPDSILVIPFLTNILPIAWVLDAEIILPEIDEDFYKSIPEIKRGYEEMYPMISFRGKVTPRRITRNTKNPKADLSPFSAEALMPTTL